MKNVCAVCARKLVEKHMATLKVKELYSNTSWDKFVKQCVGLSEGFNERVTGLGISLPPGLIADDRRAARRGARAREGGVPRRRVEEQRAAGPARRADVVGQGRQGELSVELPAARKAFVDSLLRGLRQPVAARADRPVDSEAPGQEEGRSTRVARCLRRPPVRLAVEEVKHRFHAARPVRPLPKRQPIAMLHGQTTTRRSRSGVALIREPANRADIMRTQEQ